MASGDPSHFPPAPSPQTSAQIAVIRGRCHKRSGEGRGGGEDPRRLFSVTGGLRAALQGGGSTDTGKVGA